MSSPQEPDDARAHPPSANARSAPLVLGAGPRRWCCACSVRRVAPDTGRDGATDPLGERLSAMRAASCALVMKAGSTCTAGIRVSRSIATVRRCRRPLVPSPRSSSSTMSSPRACPPGSGSWSLPNEETDGPAASGGRTRAGARCTRGARSRSRRARGRSGRRLVARRAAAPVSRRGRRARRPASAPRRMRVRRAPRGPPGRSRAPAVDRRCGNRSASASRTTARLGPDSSGRIRSSATIVCGPTMPSGSSPTFRWNSRTPGRCAAEEAVLAAGVEPERVQLALQRAHVVAAGMRRVQVEGAIAELAARLDELAPGVGADQAVDPQAAPSLERADGGVGRRPERPSSSPGSIA